MQRIGRRARLKAGMESEYVRTHRQIWPELKDVIARAGIKNYSVFIDGRELFSCFETDDLEKTMAFLKDEPVSLRWQETMAHLMECDDPEWPWQVVEEVFQLP